MYGNVRVVPTRKNGTYTLAMYIYPFYISYLPPLSIINPHQLQGRTTALSYLYSHLLMYLFMYTYMTAMAVHVHNPYDINITSEHRVSCKYTFKPYPCPIEQELSYNLMERSWGIMGVSSLYINYVLYLGTQDNYNLIVLDILKYQMNMKPHQIL